MIIRISQIKKEWKYFLAPYLGIYIIQIATQGLSNIYYLSPVKIFYFVFAYFFGNLFYYVATERPLMPQIAFYATLYSIPLIIFVVMLAFIQKAVLMHFGINIGPIIGFNY